MRRFIERDPPALRGRLAAVGAFNRVLEAIVTTCRVEHQPLRHCRIVRVLREVLPGWEQPERRVRHLFRLARWECRRGCYVPRRGRARFATGQLPVLLRLV